MFPNYGASLFDFAVPILPALLVAQGSGFQRKVVVKRSLTLVILRLSLGLLRQAQGSSASFRMTGVRSVVSARLKSCAETILPITAIPRDFGD